MGPRRRRARALLVVTLVGQLSLSAGRSRFPPHSQVLVRGMDVLSGGPKHDEGEEGVGSWFEHKVVSRSVELVTTPTLRAVAETGAGAGLAAEGEEQGGGNETGWRCGVVEYHSSQFAAFRRAVGVDDAAFMASVVEGATSEFVSNSLGSARTNQQFFWVADGRYMVSGRPAAVQTHTGGWAQVASGPPHPPPPPPSPRRARR